MAADDRPPPRPSLLAEMDAGARQAAAIERAVYTLLRPWLAPLRILSGYVSRDRQRCRQRQD
ncbi:hypothetical protein ARNL5_00727 [Anaerolineae bacterium]|nr:hypothetical protein ARNL5_00727 [Anaerolineae bacterium]